MPGVPAICDSCGAVFDPHAVEIAAGSGPIVMTGNKAGPCPRCGGMGTIPDGVYSTVGDVLTVALSENYPPETLDRIIALLGDAARAKKTAEEVADELAEEAPAVAEAVRRLLIPRTPADLYALLGLIVIVLTFARSQGAPPRSMTPEQIEHIVESAVTQAIEATEHQPPTGVKTPTLRRQERPMRPGSAGRTPKKPKKHGRRHKP